MSEEVIYSCGNCEYDEAEGELLEQCPACLEKQCPGFSQLCDILASPEISLALELGAIEEVKRRKKGGAHVK